MEKSYDQIKQNQEKGKLVVEISGDNIIVEIAGNEYGHVQGEEEICHEKSSDRLGKVNEACTDETINLEHDDSQTKDADTQPQDHDANLPEVVVDFEDMGNNEDNQTDSSHIDIVTINDDDGSTSTPTLTKISQSDVSGDILLFGNLIKNLELTTTKKSDKVKWNGDMTELKDFVALVLKVEGTWKNYAKLPTFKSKSKTLSIT